MLMYEACVVTFRLESIETYEERIEKYRQGKLETLREVVAENEPEECILVWEIETLRQGREENFARLLSKYMEDIEEEVVSTDTLRAIHDYIKAWEPIRK